MEYILLALFFIVFFIALLLLRRLMDWTTNGKHLMKHMAQSVYLTFLIYTAYLKSIDSLQVSLLGLFGILLIECFTSLLNSLKYQYPIGFERNFGGLGGGLGGWQLTGPTSYLLLCIVLIISIVISAYKLDFLQDKNGGDQKEDSINSDQNLIQNSANLIFISEDHREWR